MIARLKELLMRHGMWTVSHENPTKNGTCSEFEVDNWAISRFVLQKLVPIVGTQPFPLHELMLMVAAVCRLRPPQIFEWGTHVGKSARIFHECAVHYALDIEVHSTDLPDDVSHGEHPHSARGRLVRGRPGVFLHQGDGLSTSLEIYRTSGCKPNPLFFVDGDHSYGSVLHELTCITREVPDAAILLHDTFYQSAQLGYNVGPHEAIKSVLAGLERKYQRQDSGLGLPGMALLYPLRAATF